MKSGFAATAAAVLAAFLSACSPILVTPAAHFANGESAHALPAGKAAAGFGVALFASPSLADAVTDGWSGGVVNGGGLLGLGNHMDLGLLLESAFMSSVYSDDTVRSQQNLTATNSSATLRLKWNPDGNRFWAMTAGAGTGIFQTQGADVGTSLGAGNTIGASRPQPFYSLEHAQILSYENPYLVPYFNAKFLYNVPIHPRTYYWTAETPESGEDSLYSKRMRPSWGYELIAGLKIPFDRVYRDAAYLKMEGGLQRIDDGNQFLLSALADVEIVIPFGI